MEVLLVLLSSGSDRSRKSLEAAHTGPGTADPVVIIVIIIIIIVMNDGSNNDNNNNNIHPNNDHELTSLEISDRSRKYLGAAPAGDACGRPWPAAFWRVRMYVYRSCNVCIYIYIYIYREREREVER